MTTPPVTSRRRSPPVLPILDVGRQAMCSSDDVTWLTGEARRVMAIAFGCGVGELENGDVRTTKEWLTGVISPACHAGEFVGRGTLWSSARRGLCVVPDPRCLLYNAADRNAKPWN